MGSKGSQKTYESRAGWSGISPGYGSQSSGIIHYVATDGNDSNDGKIPDNPFLTIGAAMAASSAGDTIKIKGGIYTENVSVNLDYLKLYGEIATTIIGTITLNGDGADLQSIVISPTINQGLVINGNYCVVDLCPVVGTPITSFDVNGSYIFIQRSHAVGYTSTGYDFSSQFAIIIDSGAFGVGGNTRGFYLSASSADNISINNCFSIGNAQAGYEISIGCEFNTIKNSSSGGGDGKRIDLGTGTQWVNFVDTLPVEFHEEVWPQCDGEGAAAAPITIDNLAKDETDSGGRDDQYYFGEPKILITPITITNIWSLVGINIFANTTNKNAQGNIYRINNTIKSAKSGGNDWDEGETILTVVDGSIFLVDDLIWVYSDYKTDGEIVKITNIATNVITIARETVASGRTGLRWDHTTNDPGTEVMYLIFRSTIDEMHPSEFNYSAGSSRDFITDRFQNSRELKANDGLLVRTINLDDNLGITFDVAILWTD
jgi:hypothetical protein